MDRYVKIIQHTALATDFTLLTLRGAFANISLLAKDKKGAGK